MPKPKQTPKRHSGLLLLGLLGLFLVVQHFSSKQHGEEIRFDEFKRYIADGRVDWVTFDDDEIHGGFREGQAPSDEGTATQGATTLRFTTGRLDDDSLIPLLEEHSVAFRSLPQSGFAMGTWLYLGVSVFFMMLLFRNFRGMSGKAGGALAFGKSKGKVFQETDVTVGFSDVAGVDEAKEELEEVIEFLKSPERYKAIGAKIPKGVLLVGPPGTGKTLLARAVAGEAEVPFISINGSEFVEMFVGVGAARVRDLFAQAEVSAPCIVFIDELDAIGRTRSGVATGGGAHEEREQTLNQLLVELDGFKPKKAVIIMSATNRPEILDPALLRPGRFDRQVLVDRPDRSGRAAILRVHARSVLLNDEVDLETIAARTPGFAGADLANLVNEAALLAARHGQTTVSNSDFSEAIDRVVAGLEKKSRLMSPEERKRVAYHEVGHALASVLAGSDERVHKISIIPRGMSALGYTMQLPDRDRYLLTESELRIKLIGLLGGRAAEVLVFGEASTGAQNDLQKVTQLASAMVGEYGMSDAVGLVAVRRDTSAQFLAGPSVNGARDVGERLADTIDSEVRRIVEAAHEEALALLGANREQLETVAARLLESEQLEGEELQSLLTQTRAPS
ncbi:MAG: cell division protease FtsH [Polyangiales bacterium]|jgi:cell division protease FtsH